ncbi:MAG: AAA family ATPase, partial [Cyanobacteria bacterium J06628_3]
YLDQIGDSRPIAICAPTNKAVKVAKKMADSKGLTGLDFSTIHSLLGLTVDEKDGSKQLSKREIEPLDDYAAIIIDEASMVDEKLTEHFFTEAAYTNVIGVGDPLQLFPVKCNCSPFFNYFEKERTHTLTQVMRQQGSPAGYLVDLCGDAVEHRIKDFDPRYYIDKFQQVKDGTKGSWLIQGVDFYTTLAYAMAKARDAGEWDRTRFIAYHHKSIEQVNAWLRRSLYGEHAEKEAFLHGEPIICLSPVTRSIWDDAQNKVIKQIKLPTATEGVVLNAIEVTQTSTVSRVEPLEYTYKIWLVDVQVEGMPGTEKLRLLAPDVKRQYKEDLEGLRIAALENNYYWKYFYQLKEFIDDCRV